MAESKELMESRRLHEVTSGIAEDENLSEQLAEMVLPNVSSLVESAKTDNAHAAQILLGKGNTAFSDCTFYITNVQGEHKVQNGEERQRRQEQEASRIQDPAVGSALPSSNEFQGITLGGNSAGKVEKYDAYVCYCQKDWDFVNLMREVLEDQCKLNLCIDDRDVIPGGCDVSEKAELIKNSCRRLIVILSPDFLKVPKSDVNNFCYKFGISLEPGAESRKVIPVIVSPCEVPTIMTHLIPCDYTKKDVRQYFWPKLHKAIVSP